MSTSVVEINALSARYNRALLCEAGVASIVFIGSADCGKSSLIETSVARLRELRIAVIACGAARGSGGRMEDIAAYVAHTEVPPGQGLRAERVRHILDRVELRAFDILLIEDVSSYVGVEKDLGEEARVCVFSTTDGEYEPGRHAHLVKQAAAVVLNKIDLLPGVSFNLKTFREIVRLLNRDARLFEVSARRGDGLGAWLDWLRQMALTRRHANRWSLSKNRAAR